MRSWRQATLIATSSVSVIAAVSACGNPITANHNWQSLTAQVTVSAKLGGANATGTALFGRLVDSNGRPVRSTVVVETCIKITTPKTPEAAYRCLLLVNTGPHIYVAAGMAAGPFGKLASKAAGSKNGTISVTNLTKTPTAGKPFLIELSAVKG